MSLYSVDEIIAGIRSRDNSVLQFVYKEYYPTVHHFITTNNGNADDAKDIFQECIIVIFRKLKDEDHFFLNSSFKTFIYSIARHLWLKHLRTLKYEGQKVNDHHKYIELKEEPFKIENEELRMSLYQKYYRQLPEDCQKILSLTAHDVSQKDIASQLGFSSENYIKKRKHYCKEFLITKIKEDPLYKDLLDEA